MAGLLSKFTIFQGVPKGFRVRQKFEIDGMCVRKHFIPGNNMGKAYK